MAESRGRRSGFLSPQTCYCIIGDEENKNEPRDWEILEQIPDFTGEVLLEATRIDGLALESIPAVTPEICLAAVSNNGGALQFVGEKTTEICLAAV